MGLAKQPRHDKARTLPDRSSLAKIREVLRRGGLECKQFNLAAAKEMPRYQSGGDRRPQVEVIAGFKRASQAQHQPRKLKIKRGASCSQLKKPHVTIDSIADERVDRRTIETPKFNECYLSKNKIGL